jgi:hypothetical protein
MKMTAAIGGAIDYYRNPRRGGAPFNGQARRKRLFKQIVVAVCPEVFVETGTQLGMTTELLAEFGKPVFTVEEQPRTYGFAKARLRRRRNVTVVRGDSRAALRRWVEGPLRSLQGTVLFYLDAHGGDDLPLAEELKIIFSRCPAAVVMIDDFQVPFDPKYGYDDFGPGKILNFDYIAPTVSAYGLAGFYPATPAREESGARRGCIVLVRDAVRGAALRSLSLLRPASEGPAERAARQSAAFERVKASRAWR